jgi:hypothetical protein
MEHTLALIGEEWAEGDMLGVATFDDARFIVAAGCGAVVLAVEGFQPRGDFLGDTATGRA